MTILLWVGVGALGGAGALARFLVDGAVATRAGGPFPIGTFVVNVTGAAILGLLTGLALEGDALLLAGSGVLGSYTTFSTWMLESHHLAEDGLPAQALLNIALSLAAGLGAAVVGRALGELL